jgi:hypothetical protein
LAKAGTFDRADCSIMVWSLASRQVSKELVQGPAEKAVVVDPILGLAFLGLSPGHSGLVSSATFAGSEISIDILLNASKAAYVELRLFGSGQGVVEEGLPFPSRDEVEEVLGDFDFLRRDIGNGASGLTGALLCERIGTLRRGTKRRSWVAEFKRVLKPTGNLFAFTSYNLLGQWHAAFDSEFDTFQFMVWHKRNPPPKLRRAGFLNSCELIVCARNKGHTWNFGKQREMHNFIETPICMGKERLKNPKHPTQKPLKVLEHLLKLGSREGDLVFDPFMGVGSSGVAALNMKRRFLGFDNEPIYDRCLRRETWKMAD